MGCISVEYVDIELGKKQKRLKSWGKKAMPSPSQNGILIQYNDILKASNQLKVNVQHF